MKQNHILIFTSLLLFTSTRGDGGKLLLNNKTKKNTTTTNKNNINNKPIIIYCYINYYYSYNCQQLLFYYGQNFKFSLSQTKRKLLRKRILYIKTTNIKKRRMEVRRIPKFTSFFSLFSLAFFYIKNLLFSRSIFFNHIQLDTIWSSVWYILYK